MFKKISLCVLCFQSVFIQAQTYTEENPMHKKFELFAGYSTMNFDSSVSIRTQDGSRDKEISLEDDLGFDKKLDFLVLGASWRFADVHRLRASYLPMRRKSSFVAEEDRTITVGGETKTIKAGSFIESVFKPNIVDIDYLYSFYQRPNMELSASFGLYWVIQSIDIHASGVIETDGDAGVIEKEFSTQQKITAPLPLFGLHGHYGFHPRWELTGSLRYVAAKIGTIDSAIINANLGIEYNITPSFALGLSASSFDLSVKNDGVILNNALKWTYSGGLAYFKYNY